MADNKNPGNFANDREKAAEAGHKGGQHSSSHATQTSHDKDNHSKSGSHGSGNFADDREKAAEAGRKGGSR